MQCIRKNFEMENLSTPSQTKNISSQELSTLTIEDQSSQAKAREVMFGVIARSFLFNFLFCVIMIRKPAMLKRPHNILLFSLAITDLLTGLQFYMCFILHNLSV